MKPQVETQRQATGGSDSGQGSEADDGIRMAYHFYIPSHLCGKKWNNTSLKKYVSSNFLVVANRVHINYMIFKISGKMIGKKGETVKQFKNETKCSITLQERNDNTQTRYKDNRR